MQIFSIQYYYIVKCIIIYWEGLGSPICCIQYYYIAKCIIIIGEGYMVTYHVSNRV